MTQNQTLAETYDAWLDSVPWQIAVTLELSPETLHAIDQTPPQAGPSAAQAAGGHHRRNQSARSLYTADDLQRLIYRGLFQPLQRQFRGMHVTAIGALVAPGGNDHAHIVALDASDRYNLADLLDTTDSLNWGWHNALRLYGHRSHPLRFRPPELLSRPYQGQDDHIRAYLAHNLYSDDRQGLNQLLTWGTRRLKQNFRHLAYRHAA